MTGSLSTRKVFLVGFMGAGKTTVGRLLAQRLQWKFYDLDEVIESRERRTIAEIFAAQGEAAFRDIESATLQSLLLQSPSSGDMVVALGGGAFIQPRNRRHLRDERAITVLLEAPVEELRKRLIGQTSGRPLARDQQAFTELFEQRRSAYDLAALKVQTSGKAVHEVAAEIERLLRQHEDREVAP